MPIDPETMEVLSSLRTSDSAQLQMKLAMAQEKLRHGQKRVQGAIEASRQAELQEQRREWMESHPVQIEEAESIDAWRPGAKSWFKVAGETDQALEDRLNAVKQGGSRQSQLSHQSARVGTSLVSLQVSAAGAAVKLKPGFAPDTPKYSVFVGSATREVTVQPAPMDARAKVLVEGTEAPSGGVIVPLGPSGARKIRIAVQPSSRVSADSEPERHYELLLWKQGPKGTPTGDYVAQRKKPGTECSASKDCRESKVCVWGHCVCPVLYRNKKASGPCAPSTKLPQWCLQPLGAAPLTTLFDASHVNTPEEKTELQGINKPGYSRELATSKYFKGFESRSTDLLLHSGNKLGKDLAANVAGRSSTSKPKIVDKDLHDPVWGIDWGVCAVVGGSGSLLGSGLGALIDDHTAVIRVGDNPTRGHEVDVGGRTSARRQSPETAGFSESRGGGRNSAELCVVNIRSRRGGELLATDGSSRCIVVELSPQFEQYFRYNWRAFPPPGQSYPPSIATWSPDFTAVVLAMHLCGRVDVFGMSFAPQSQSRSSAMMMSGATQQYSARATGLIGGPNQGNTHLEGTCGAQLATLPGVAFF